MSRTQSTLSLPRSEILHPNDPEKAHHTKEPSPAETTDPFLVSLDPSEDPLTMPVLRKWLTVAIISTSSLCVTSLSSIAAFTEVGVEREFNVSHTIAVLSVSLFVLGLGIGPLFVGPLSEVYGRNIVYQSSFFLLFCFSWAVTFAPDIVVYLVFRLLTGLCGAAFLSVAGGTVSDLFIASKVANPMAFYTLSPFVGPVLGPLLGGFINQHLYWRWTYRIMLIWVFVQLIALLLFVPETYTPVLLKRKAVNMRRETGDSRFYAPLDRLNKSIIESIMISCYKPFELILFDRMALLLDIWSASVLGILYLTFQAFPYIFSVVHGFNMQMTGLTFLGIGLGMILGAATQPLWNRYAASCCRCPEVRQEKLMNVSDHANLDVNASTTTLPTSNIHPFAAVTANGSHLDSSSFVFGSATTLAVSRPSTPMPDITPTNTHTSTPKYLTPKSCPHDSTPSPPPEVRLTMAKFGAVLIPLSLFLLAFTTYPQIHPIIPILTTIPFGTGVYFVFTSVFTYLVLAYRPVAASALAGNTAMRCSFAAGFPLFAGAMYERLGTVGATAVLAGVMTVMAPLPFVFSKIGARMRATSRFAVC